MAEDKNKPTVEELQKQLDDKNAENEKLQEENSTLKEIKAEQDKLIEKKEKEAPKVIVEHDDVKYEVTIPQFSHPELNGGEPVKAAELKENAKLVAELVEIGFGGLKKL